MVVVEEAASLGGRDARTPSRSDDPPDFEGRQEALLSAARAALAILMLSVAWMATGWSEGFTAVSGGAIMLFFAVNQDNPEASARTFLVWSACGILLSYLAMVFVLPHLEGFEALTLVLILLLLPAGLMAGTPSRAVAGMALGGFTIAQIGTGNVFTPNEQAFVNSAAALIFGMVVCLAVIAAMPVTSRSRRDRSWRHVIGVVLPAVAARVDQPAPRLGRDRRHAGRPAAAPGLDRQRDEDFFRGTLGAASSAIELGRLVDLKSDRDMPRDAALAVERFLDRFASALENLAMEGAEGVADRLSRLAEAEAIVTDMRVELSSLPLTPGPAARSTAASRCLVALHRRPLLHRPRLSRARLRRSLTLLVKQGSNIWIRQTSPSFTPWSSSASICRRWHCGPARRLFHSPCYGG